MARMWLTMIGVVVCVGSAAGQHAGDVWVGRHSDGQLGISGFPVERAVTVLEPTSGLLTGFSDNSTGFDRLIEAEPERDLWPLESGAQVYLEVVAIDPAFAVIDNSFQFVDPGEMTYLGNHLMHAHLTWYINSTDPGYDPEQRHWTVTLVLHDLGSTGYTASAPFVMYFTDIDRPLGDLNDDGVVDVFDINPFVDVLLNPDAGTREELFAADLNLDGVVDVFDINPFVELILATE